MKTAPIQLIITDQRIPEMTGIQFLEKIIPDYPDCIRMILTGFSDIEAIIPGHQYWKGLPLYYKAME